MEKVSLHLQFFQNTFLGEKPPLQFFTMASFLNELHNPQVVFKTGRRPPLSTHYFKIQDHPLNFDIDRVTGCREQSEAFPPLGYIPAL